MYVDLVAHEESGELVEDLQANVSALVQIGFGNTAANLSLTQCMSLMILHTLVKRLPATIGSIGNLGLLSQHWQRHKTSLAFADGQLGLASLYHWTLLLQIFMAHWRNKHDIAAVFEIVDLLAIVSFQDNMTIKQFVMDDVVLNAPFKVKQELLRQFLAMASPESQKPKLNLAVYLKVVIVPMLVCNLKSPGGPKLIDQDILTKTHKNVWLPNVCASNRASDTISS